MKDLKNIFLPLITVIGLFGIFVLLVTGKIQLPVPSYDSKPTAWETYSYKPADKISDWSGVFPWKGFVMHYPNNWALSEIKNEPNKGKLELTAKRSDKSFFEIVQGTGVAGRCLFPDDSDFDTFSGNAVSFNRYKEFNKGGYVWRLAQFDIVSGGWSHALCQKAKDSEGKTVYYSTNVVGIKRILLNSSTAYKEFVAVLEKLEIK